MNETIRNGRSLVPSTSFLACFLAMMALIAGHAATAGQLQLGDPALDGDRITVPIMLDADASGEISSLDFRLRYDPNQLRPVGAAAGAAARNADKDVMVNERDPGDFSVIMMGLNRNVVSDGEIATVTFQRVGNAGAADVRITQTTFASPDAIEIPSRGSSRTLRWGEGPETVAAADRETSAQPSAQQAGTTSPQAEDASGAPGTTAPQAGGVPGAAGGVFDPDTLPTPGQPEVPVADAGQPGAAASAGDAGNPDASVAPGASAEVQERLRGAIASADSARDAVDAPTASRQIPGAPRDSQRAQLEGTPVEVAGPGEQQASGSLQVAQARDPETATRGGQPSRDEVTGGQVPQGLPDTSGEPVNIPLLIAAAVTLVAIGGVFFIRKKLFS